MSAVSTPWPTVPLHEICSPKQWPTIPQTAFLAEGYPVYGANGVIGYYSEFNHEKPTVLITCRGATCGTINLCAPKSYVTGNAMALDDLDETRVELRYLVRALRNGSLRKAISGTAQPQITRQGLTVISIPLPPVPEQRRIAEVLDRAEALRAKRRAALAQLNTLNQSIFLDLFGNPDTRPNKWPRTTLGDLCDRVIDCPHSTPVYANHRTPNPCVRSSDIQDGYFDLADAKFVDKGEYERRIERGKPERGDVVYCREGARFGNAARLIDDTQLCLGQRMMLLRPRTDAAVSEYLWAFLESPAGYRAATFSVDGSASPHVNIKDIVAFQLAAPPLSLQREFARRVVAVDKLKTVHRTSLAELDALFAVLQHRAFRGEL